MTTPNVVGYVTEYVENRHVEAVPDEDNPGFFKELVPGKTTVRLKLKLKNTLGKEREIWVEGPADLAEFFAA